MMKTRTKTKTRMTEPVPDRQSHASSGATIRTLLVGVVALQLLSAVFFSYDILGTMVGIRTQPLDWWTHELIEIGAVIGLVVGTMFGLIALRHSDARRREAEDKLAVISGAFHDLLEERFADWMLTPAEHDVAFFVMKGLSTQEIAGLRNTSEGTVKAQTNAIYRKAGVTGRVQLVSLFIDDLMNDQLSLPAPESSDAS